jgi:hypothetical protein
MCGGRCAAEWGVLGDGWGVDVAFLNKPYQLFQKALGAVGLLLEDLTGGVGGAQEALDG